MELEASLVMAHHIRVHHISRLAPPIAIAIIDGSSMWGVFGATVVVAATSIDDAVWLVPYTTSPRLPLAIRLLHGAIFVCTLETLALLCCLSAQAVYHVVGQQDEWIFGAIGATLCWIIAGILYVKKLLKKRRRQQRLEQEASSNNGYGAVAIDEEKTYEEEVESSILFSPWTVISLTFLGSLDEISYFPALLVGGVFTNIELCVGTLLAACLILVTITVFLSQCKPLIDWLDSIPLYGIVGVFAIVLTVGVIVDVFSDEDS